MPQKTQQRTLDAEVELAATIAGLRKEKGWTYEELAERMAAVGCKIHPSGIQKTEKSGRRITVDELIGYSRALEVPVDLLIDSTQPRATTKEFWRDHLAAERFHDLKHSAERSYWEMIRGVQAEAARNPELRAAIEARLNSHKAMLEKRARDMAKQDNVDISTPDKFQEYLWNWWADSAMFAARDVLEGAQDGEG
jgi:transcriptional regulator with XRE-family HTH domain